MQKLVTARRALGLQKEFLKISPLVQSTRFKSDSEDDAKSKKITEETAKSQIALHKLNDLLKLMLNDEPKSELKLDLAKPKNRRKTPEERKKEPKSDDKSIENAVKNVAESIGGDVKQTESELLLKLLGANQPTSSLSDVVKDMPIEREAKGDQSRADQVRKIIERTKPGNYIRQPRAVKETPRVKISLFGAQPLGVFTGAQLGSAGVQNKIWDKLYERDLKLAVTHPPSNYFQQLIYWTEQGKIWQFPIDNEQGLDQERQVDFTEHIFLEKHLESWCPSKGPIRHFMELVCVGLSKNPYLTVEAKKEHILWFEKYFNEKKQLLSEVGLTLGNESEQDVKQIQ